MPTLSASSRAVMSAAFAALLAVSTYLSHAVSDGVVIALMLIFAIGWPRLVDVPAVNQRRALLLGMVVVASVTVYLTQNLRLLAGVMALGVIASFILELARRDGRPRLVESLSASVAGLVVIVSGAGWLAMPHTELGVAVVLTTAGTLAAAAACAAIHLPPWPHAITTILGATAIGLVAALTLPGLRFVAVAIGFATGLLSAALYQMLCKYAAAGRFSAALAAASLPVVVVGIPVYTLVRFFLV